MAEFRIRTSKVRERAMALLKADIAERGELPSYAHPQLVERRQRLKDIIGMSNIAVSYGYTPSTDSDRGVPIMWINVEDAKCLEYFK